MADPPRVPQLLVSVRNVIEATAAMAGGCDVVDVKEPNRGSLGRADYELAAAVVQAVADRRPTSVALGELRDWNGGTLPDGVRFAKFGLSGLAEVPDWPTRWQQVRQRVEASLSEPVGWVAVVYADWRTAGAPCPEDIVDAAIRSDCAAVLVDTFAKNGRTLIDWMERDTLTSLAERVRSAGLRFVLAGGLNSGTLSKLRGIPCDLLAIRTAACGNTDRNGSVCTEAVRNFATAIRAAFTEERGSATCWS